MNSLANLEGQGGGGSKVISLPIPSGNLNGVKGVGDLSKITADNFVIKVTSAFAQPARNPQGNPNFNMPCTLYPAVSYNSTTGDYSITGTSGSSGSGNNTYISSMSIGYSALYLII